MQSHNKVFAAQEVARARHWRSLICVLSMDLTESFYRLLGCPVDESFDLCELAVGVVRDHPNAFRGRVSQPFIDMLSDFLDRLEGRFGARLEERFLSWVKLVWIQLDGPTWDWFAYDFAFSHWYNSFSSSGNDMFSLGSHASSVAELFDESFRRTVSDFNRQIGEWPSLTPSAWDRAVLDMAHWRLCETGPEEIGELATVVRSPVRAHQFQEFWRILIERVGQTALLPMRSQVEELIRREATFPLRSLLCASDLPMVAREK